MFPRSGENEKNSRKPINGLVIAFCTIKYIGGGPFFPGVSNDREKLLTVSNLPKGRKKPGGLGIFLKEAPDLIMRQKRL